MDMKRASKEMIHRSLGAYQPKCSVEEAAVKRAQESGFDDEHFHVGDEVISTCGSIAGVIISISGNDALISWACRGKSVEPVSNLAHTEHQNT